MCAHFHSSGYIPDFIMRLKSSVIGLPSISAASIKMEDSISDSPLPELEVKAFKPLITSSIVKSGRLNSTYFLLEKLLNLGFDLKKFLT